MIIERDLTAAPAAPVVLTILSEGESSGYEILKRLRELSEAEFDWTDAMAYPLFHPAQAGRVLDDGVASAGRRSASQLLHDH